MDSNEDMDNLYRNDDDDDFSSGISSSSNTKKGKRSKSKSKANKLFYFKIIFAMLVVEAYYSYNFSTVKDFTLTTEIQLNELNLTSSIEPYFWFSFNTQREMMYNKSKPIMKQDSFKMATKTIYVMNQLSNDLVDQHLQN